MGCDCRRQIQYEVWQLYRNGYSRRFIADFQRIPVDAVTQILREGGYNPEANDR